MNDNHTPPRVQCIRHSPVNRFASRGIGVVNGQDNLRLVNSESGRRSTGIPAFSVPQPLSNGYIAPACRSSAPRNTVPTWRPAPHGEAHRITEVRRHTAVSYSPFQLPRAPGGTGHHKLRNAVGPQHHNALKQFPASAVCSPNLPRRSPRRSAWESGRVRYSKVFPHTLTTSPQNLILLLL